MHCPLVDYHGEAAQPGYIQSRKPDHFFSFVCMGDGNISHPIHTHKRPRTIQQHAQIYLAIYIHLLYSYSYKLHALFYSYIAIATY